MQAEFATLSSGARMPIMGLGTWKIPESDVANVVEEAIRVGYTHIDCAADYGNERQVGEGIAEALTKIPGLTREKLWITSKLPNSCHRKEHVRMCCEETLRDLGVDYLDLYLIHFPISFAWLEKRANVTKDQGGKLAFDPVPLAETWAAMEALVDAGLVKHIGVSNFNAQLLLDLMSYARIPPEVNQFETHPYLSQERLIAFCQAHGIHATGYSPLGSSGYDSMGMTKGFPSLMELPVVKSIAAKHGSTPGQVLLSWGLSRNISIIPKTKTASRLPENLGALTLKLDSEDIKAINGLNRNVRFADPESFFETDLFA